MQAVKWFSRFVLLYVLFVILFVAGSFAVVGMMPENAATEPGVVSGTSGLLIIALINVAIISALILSSHSHKWKLAIALSFSYYLVTTFLMQIESWFFLSDISVDQQLVPRLFLMGVPTAFIFVPIAVWLWGDWRIYTSMSQSPTVTMPVSQWVMKLSLLAVAYLILYWSAGYFIAWQNPELRAFYGQPGDALPFWAHTFQSLSEDPGLFVLQLLRGVVWSVCALIIIRLSRVGPWLTAILTGLLFSLPQNIVHLLANPLMPLASVRFSHMVETALSTFVFGLLAVWVLHRAHTSFKDLFGHQRA